MAYGLLLFGVNQLLSDWIRNSFGEVLKRWHKPNANKCFNLTQIHKNPYLGTFCWELATFVGRIGKETIR